MIATAEPLATNDDWEIQMTDTATTAAAASKLNGHAALRTDPDPPKHKRTRIVRELTLNMTTPERLDLWQQVCDTEGHVVIAVPRKALMHLLMDHATMVAHLVRLITIREQARELPP